MHGSCLVEDMACPRGIKTLNLIAKRWTALQVDNSCRKEKPRSKECSSARHGSVKGNPWKRLYLPAKAAGGRMTRACMWNYVDPFVGFYANRGSEDPEYQARWTWQSTPLEAGFPVFVMALEFPCLMGFHLNRPGAFVPAPSLFCIWHKKKTT